MAQFSHKSQPYNGHGALVRCFTFSESSLWDLRLGWPVGGVDLLTAHIAAYGERDGAFPNLTYKLFSF